MGLEENKAIFRRFIQEVFNEGKVELIEELFSWDYTFHDAPPESIQGPARVREVVLGFHTAFPDIHLTVDHQIAEGDLVCSRHTYYGTHQGMIFGIPPSGKRIVMKGLSVVRIRNGRISDAWLKNDVTGLLLQIGASIKP